MSSALKQAEDIVDSLKPEERDQLRRYIDAAREVASQQTTADDAWLAFREIGRQIAAIPRGEISSAELVSEMRR